MRLLVNEDATQDAMNDALEGWASDRKRVGENDLLVIFYAGHGVTRDPGSRGSRGYLVPEETNPVHSFRSPDLPAAIEPCRSSRLGARAPLIVAIFSTSARGMPERARI